MLPSAVSDSRVHNILPNKIDTDFQFSRASAATRVNHQGLIEEVGYFGPELVQNGDFSELGPELVTNGDFATDSNWANSTINGYSINNGKLNLDNVAYAQTVVQANVTTVNKIFKVVFTISNYVKGSVRIFLGGGATPTVNANGTYTFYEEATVNTAIGVQALSGGGTTLSIDNVSIKQVDPDDDWTLGTGWSYGDGVAISTTAQTNLTCNSATLEIGKTYKFEVDAAAISSGSFGFLLRFNTTNTNIGTINADGSYSFVATADATSFRLQTLSGGSTSFSVDNISVVEIQGDRPRLNYDPTNPTCPHLLLEPQSTNLIKFSNDYTQSEWNKINGATVDANVAISPDGTLNASRLNFDTVSGSRIEDQIPGAASGDYSFAVYLKADEPKTVGIRTGFAGTPTVNVNVTTEWQRFSITQNNPTNPANGYAQIRSIDASGGSVYVWGAQIEQLSYSTSLIPTAGSTETRVAETCNSAGNVNTFNNAEGVIYAEIAALVATAPLSQYITISDRTYDNRASILFSNGATNQIRCFLRVGGVSQVDVSDNVTDVTAFNKIAFSYKANDFKVYINGSLVSSDTSGSVWPAGTIDTLSFSEINTNTGRLNARVKSLATYKRALTDTELYTITSTQYSAYSGMVAALGNYTIPC